MNSTTSHTLCARVYIVVYTQSIKSIHPEQQQPPPPSYQKGLKKKRRESRVLSIDCGVTVTDAHSIAPLLLYIYFLMLSLKKKKREPSTYSIRRLSTLLPQLASRMFWKKKRIYIVSRASHTVVPISLVVCVCVCILKVIHLSIILREKIAKAAHKSVYGPEALIHEANRD